MYTWFDDDLCIKTFSFPDIVFNVGISIGREVISLEGNCTDCNRPTKGSILTKDSVRIMQQWVAFLQPKLYSQCNMCYILSACLSVAVVTQHAMGCAIFLSLVYPALEYFSKLSHKVHHFRKKLFNTKCVVLSSKTLVWSISHSKKSWVKYDQKCLYVK